MPFFKFFTRATLLWLFATQIILAQSGQVQNATCDIHLEKTEDEDLLQLLDAASLKLRTLGYNLVISNFSQEIGEKQFYFQLEKEIENKGFYPPCHIKIFLKETAKKNITKADKVIYEYKTRRELPRTTPNSLSRCVLATKDAFVFFPSCLKK